MATSNIMHDAPILFKTMTRVITSHATGTNFWGMDPFPPKAGYTRKVGCYSSTNANVEIVGYYVENNQLIVRTKNTGTSAQSNVELTVTAFYIRDDLVWA